MNIRTADAKGRIKVSHQGKVYSQVTQEDGTITLTPIEIPKPPKIDTGSMDGIYVSPGDITRRSTVTIFSVANWQDVVETAKLHKLPIVVDTKGLGQAHFDTMVKLANGEVEVYGVGGY